MQQHVKMPRSQNSDFPESLLDIFTASALPRRSADSQPIPDDVTPTDCLCVHGQLVGRVPCVRACTRRIATLVIQPSEDGPCVV